MRTHRWVLALAVGSTAAIAGPTFDGKFFQGSGDSEYLQFLDIARRMFDADAEFQCLPMLYMPEWNGLVEGPTWDAWWIQNSYGTTLCALPFYEEPFTTFLKNSHDLWFDQMGDGQRKWSVEVAGAKREWVPPDGCLCDAASPGRFIAKQGDGRVDIHDWGMEFTAAGLLMQAELLLISRDKEEIKHYLPKLERCATFLESRRDPSKNLFLAGPAGNLLAPSYAGYKNPDGTYDKAYLTGLSITYIAALDRMVELETLAGNPNMGKLYASRRDSARQGLAALTTEEGYFIRSLDPDGTRHGVFGAPKHGYFEASPNHDAIALRVVDNEQARKIYAKIASIPELRPHALILPNYPGYDDMYEEPQGLWEFGRWVNGGHWSTCEARMIMAYYRLGEFEDARRSMRQLMKFARRWRMDNPLTDFGNDVYQPQHAINLCYDTFGPAAALIRGLFEYLYQADRLILIPHIPPGITSLRQKFPIRFGCKKLYLSVAGKGPITGVWINGRALASFDAQQIRLEYEEIPAVAHISISLGNAQTQPATTEPAVTLSSQPARVPTSLPASMPALAAIDAKVTQELGPRLAKLSSFIEQMDAAGRGKSYETAHARLVAKFILAIQERQELLATGKLTPLPEPARTAAEKCYLDTAAKLYDGLDAVMKKHAGSGPGRQKDIAQLWLPASRDKSGK